jgi:hypothetical protein
MGKTRKVGNMPRKGRHAGPANAEAPAENGWPRSAFLSSFWRPRLTPRSRLHGTNSVSARALRLVRKLPCNGLIENI